MFRSLTTQSQDNFLLILFHKAVAGTLFLRIVHLRYKNQMRCLLVQQELISNEGCQLTTANLLYKV